MSSPATATEPEVASPLSLTVILSTPVIFPLVVTVLELAEIIASSEVSVAEVPAAIVTASSLLKKQSLRP